MIQSVCSNIDNMSLQLTQLEKFTPYTITIAGVVRKGLTNSTEGITVFTDEDSKYRTWTSYSKMAITKRN